MTPEVLTETFKSLSDGLYRVAYYILESENDAQDAVQDLFVKLWGNRDQLDTVLNFKASCTTLMKNLSYGKGYQYAHDYEEKITAMQCLPDALKDRKFYHPTTQGQEARYKERLEQIEAWKKEHRKG